MRCPTSTLRLVAFVSLVVLLVLNLNAQRETQQKLDAVLTELANRPTPALQAAPAPTPIVVPTPGVVPIELNHLLLPVEHREVPDNAAAPRKPLVEEFIISPDGTATLKLRGTLFGTALTTERAMECIHAALSKYSSRALSVESLRVVLDIVVAPQQHYHVAFAGEDDFGKQVCTYRLTGTETVLDAVVNSGVQEISKLSVEVVRKSDGVKKVLPVDWAAIINDNVTKTNYPLQPGDVIRVEHRK